MNGFNALQILKRSSPLHKATFSSDLLGRSAPRSWHICLALVQVCLFWADQTQRSLSIFFQLDRSQTLPWI